MDALDKLAAAFGALVIIGLLVILAFFSTKEHPPITSCSERGGISVKADYGYVCVRQDVLLK